MAKKKQIARMETVLERLKQNILSIHLWKTKDMELSAENIQENVFLLSTDLAGFLNMRHNDLFRRNIAKLLKYKYLSEHIRMAALMIDVGKSAQRLQNVYALSPKETEIVLMDMSEEKSWQKKFDLLLALQNIENLILQDIGIDDVEEYINEDASEIPLAIDILEPYMTTNEGIQLWKKKDVTITLDNVLDSIVVLSSDLAAYFSIRHNNLINQNIAKLQKEGLMSEHLLKIKQMFTIGNQARREQIVYGLTRHQTYRLIMDLAGPKARLKKYAIVSRLEAIEADVLQGAFESAREKALEWDGIALLERHGLHCSIPGNIATRKDIASFLQVPMTTLNSFLTRNDTIQPIPLDKETIRNSHHKSSRLLGYKPEDTLKIAFWMDSPKGAEIKRQMASRMGLGSLERMVQPKTETEWREALSKVFDGLGFYTNYSIGKYRVDFYVDQLSMVLECDGDSHKYYNAKAEKEREVAIVESCSMVRFHSQSLWEDVVNGILIVKLHGIIRVGCRRAGQRRRGL